MKGEVKQEYDFVGKVKLTKIKDAARITTVTVFFYCIATSSVTDHYAKDGGPGEVCPSIHVVFTMILCSSNFSIW